MPTIDWGHVTPESANLQTNTFVYVYNHDLSSPEKIDRTIRFILGRLNYYDQQLPENPIHIIKIDVRGQHVNSRDCDSILMQLKTLYIKPASISIEIIKA